MIKKYLVLQKQIYLANKKPTEFEGEIPEIMEISMPVQSFWEVRELLESSDYMIASRADAVAIQEVYKKVFKMLAPWAVVEVQRTFLYQKSI